MNAGPATSEPLRLLSLRVSRDGGRTWGPERQVWSSEPLAHAIWPPCQCPRCRATGGTGGTGRAGG
ncbi:hypothetical protein [Streptomyces sp. TRM64462]|uniref:hypothetical protein n=1 Tax=Streptomyces sp. TRM64462 TaxID=2741726 RepID=UPI001585D42E|nr:hypothetical protein [Streptomyces sp. TRM64462]